MKPHWDESATVCGAGRARFAFVILPESGIHKIGWTILVILLLPSRDLKPFADARNIAGIENVFDIISCSNFRYLERCVWSWCLSFCMRMPLINIPTILGQRKTPFLHYAQFGISLDKSSSISRNLSCKSASNAKMGEANPPLRYIDVGSRSHNLPF